MEPWAFDSPAMRGLLPLILAGEFLPNMPVARTDDDLFVTRMFLPMDDSRNSHH